jgi:hypothetical protein
MIFPQNEGKKNRKEIIFGLRIVNKGVASNIIQNTFRIKTMPKYVAISPATTLSEM